MRKLVSMMLGILLVSLQVLAQTRTISGKITDEKGNGIPNATVLVKGTSLGTTTAMDGSYTINVPENAKTLVISSIGLVTRKVSIGNQSSMNVSLRNVDSSMDEVVIVGYSTVNKRNLSGAVTKVVGKEIENKPVLSFDQALTGRGC